ncbi:MAG TPA: electron transfer flavoprotein-ubiquinone oxidoreductase [Planctomycetota bacterium]|jgi:electron-transferring-flavoprotein dehydrogenase|nr:electron transfer flavoprotein-ubiquinone oxidoreductase [Planctomycetota bacterium]
MERETLKVDVLVLGAGPAGLATAIRLGQALKAGGREASVLVLEKGEEVGFHSLSGAVMDPRGMAELLPDFLEKGFPSEGTVVRDEMRFLTSRRSAGVGEGLLPRELRNRGHLVVSLYRVVRWMKEQAEGLGVEVHAGFAGAEVLYGEGGAVVGVRTRDSGVNKRGERKANYQPGMDVRAKVVVFSEGPRGSLTKSLVARKRLDEGRNAQVYATGLKEVWEVPRDFGGRVVHTLGWPLDASKYGGGWIYGMSGRRLSIGFVVGLDYGDPRFDPHEAFQRWKTHPFVARLLEGGTLLRYGAKTIPEGGYFAMPRLYGDGFVLVGDAAGFLNARRLKGIHLAIKSGMLAAEAIVEALGAEDFSASRLRRYEALFEASWARAELWSCRNFRQAFSRGLWPGLLRAGLQLLLGGRILRARLPSKIDPAHYRRLEGAPPPPRLAFDGKTTFDKLTDVFHSGTVHEEDQPSHLLVLDPRICVERCETEYGNPCQRFCPAQVYEWSDHALRINAANCVHCKTCDVADPYQVIQWVVPEGGGGPKYVDL